MNVSPLHEGIDQRIKQLRKLEMLTQLEFAQKLGVTNAHISKIESGKTVPSDSLIKLICSKFQVSEEWLTKGIGPMDIEEIEKQSESNFEKSFSTNRNLMKTDDPILRYKLSQLRVTIENIINMNTLPESQKRIYLEMLLNLFKEIESTMTFFKSYAFDGQMSFMPDDQQKILDFQLNNVNNSLSSFMEFFKNAQSNK